MSRKIVITISREYGSGGKEVAKLLSQKLNIPYYDKELLLQINERSGIDEELYNQIYEQISKKEYYLSIPTTKFMGPSAVLGELSMHEKIYQVQKEVIENLAKKSCVILGRCSDYILRDSPDTVLVYISANPEDKKKRAIEDYYEETKDIEKTLADMDRRRANYYNYFSNQVWGKIGNYDLVVNTSKVGLEHAAEVIISYIQGRQ